MKRNEPRLISLLVVLFIGVGLAALGVSWLANDGLVKAAPSPVVRTLYVDAATGNDANDCLSPGAACKTIKGAVGKAINDDVIQIAAGVYAENDIQISLRLTLVGAGIGDTIVDGSGGGRIFKTSTDVTLSGMTIQNGNITTPSSNLFDTAGGAIQNLQKLTIQDSLIVSNTTIGSGGGIFNNGTLILDNTDVLSNTVEGVGGGIYNYALGVITITNGTVGGNTAKGYSGGGIQTSQPLYLTNVTVRDNSAGTFGGGLLLGNTSVLEGVTLTGNQSAAGAALFAQTGTITLTNTTVSQNTASNNQAGIYVTGPGVSLYLVNSTVAYNHRTNSIGTGFNGVVIGNNASASFLNTIIAFNDGRNCSGTTGNWTSLGHNLSSDVYCAFTQPGDIQGTDPMLGPLADNGGATLTHALLPLSPAIDGGDNLGCPATDQRGVARPYDGDNDGTATCDIGAVEARHQLMIADTAISEGDTGTSTAVFTVTLAPTSTQLITVAYATVNGTALAGSDFISATGVVTFNPGVDTRPIDIQIIGDLFDEPDEQFTVQLSTVANVDLLNDQATGTIVDDDGLPALTISDQTVLEGNTGTVEAVFDVTLSPASLNVVTVDYGTADGTASAGSDYTLISDTLTFQPGETSQTITVTVNGDNVDEGTSEAFMVDLSNPSNANIADNQGVGTITDDDTARLSQGAGPQVLEGDSGFTPAVFTITMSTPAAFVVTVDFDVNSGYGDSGAKAGEDFVPISGTLTYQPGETIQTFTVQVIGDTEAEQDEVYNTIISNANVPISVNGSIAWVLNDDNYKLYLPLIQK